MKKKPPSKIRYEKSHPVVSARIDKATHEKLREMLNSEGKTFANFLKEVISKRKKKWDAAYQTGYTKGEEEHRIWFYCCECGEKVFIEPNDKSHKDIINYLKSERWGHRRCVE